MSNFLNFIFKKESSTASHVSFRIFGIKLNILKFSILKERKQIAKYYQSFKNASDIPKSGGNLRLIQEAYCGFLKLFDKICEENNLKYWIDFGTLLGAIRHHGFIPWDDDVDIAMPRDDYEKFIDNFKDGFENYPYLKIVFENNFRNKCFIKFCDKRSKNLKLDIFPYDFHYASLNDVEKQEFSQKIEKIRKRNKKFKTLEQTRENIKTLTSQYLLENKTQQSDKPSIFMAIDFPHSHKNKVLNWDDVFPLKKINFENIQLFAPQNPDNVLKALFGNYMSIPKDSYPRHSLYSEISQEEREILEKYAK